MKRLVSICILAFCILAPALYSNGLSLNSIGTRALGMGGAFIGIADDYSAVYWNPAGISQINNTQVAAFFTGVMPSATYKYDISVQGQTINVADATSESALFPTGGFMGYFPIITGTLNAGIGAYIPSGIGVTWNGDDLMKMTNNTSYKWRSKIGVITIAPAVSFNILNNLFVGAALNISYGMFDLDRPMSSMNPMNQQQIWGQYSESSTGFGFGGTIGVLFKPTNQISVGVTYRTENSIAFEGTASNGIVKMFMQSNYKDADLSREVVWPTWIGGGIAYKPINGLTIALDAQYSQWSILDSIETTYTNWSPFVTKNQMILKWEDCIQYRFGVEYELLSTLAVRAGFYIDPAPAPDETLNILFPSIDYKVVTAGASLKLPSITFDAGFEYLMGTERDNRTTVNTSEGGMPGIHNNNIFAFSLGFCLDL